MKKNYLFQFSNIKWNWNAQKCPFPFQFHNENRMALSVHGLMRVWEVSFHFQFKIEIKIDKNVNFDFCLNIEFWILTLKPNVRLQYLDWKANFEITYFYFSFFYFKMNFAWVEKHYLIINSDRLLLKSFRELPCQFASVSRTQEEWLLLVISAIYLPNAKPWKLLWRYSILNVHCKHMIFFSKSFSRQKQLAEWQLSQVKFSIYW